MPGIEDTISRVNPNALTAGSELGITKPAVTTDAVEALSRAIRAGQVSADDFIDRYGELAQAKKIAGVQGLHEFISPEAIHARRAQIQASGAKSGLETAQAGAEQGLLDPTTKLQQTKLQLAQAAADSPGVEEYQKYAGLFGVASHPRKDDGSLDTQKIAKMGARMAQVMAARAIAQQQLASVQLKEGSQPGEYIRMGPGGTPIPGGIAASLAATATQPLPDIEREFSGAAPGEATPYYGIGNEGLITGPKTAAPAAKPAAKPTIEAETSSLTANPNSAVISMGEKPLTPEQASKLEDQAAQFGELSTLVNNADHIVAQGNVNGPVAGNPLVAGASTLFTQLTGLNEQNYQDRMELTKLINSKILEKSTLLRPVSDKDLAFLQAAAPNLKDTSATWNKYLNEWHAYLDRHKELVAKRLKVPVEEIFPKSVTGTPGAAQGAQGVTKNVNGILWRRSPDGRYENLGPAK